MQAHLKAVSDFCQQKQQEEPTADLRADLLRLFKLHSLNLTKEQEQRRLSLEEVDNRFEDIQSQINAITKHNKGFQQQA